MEAGASRQRAEAMKPDQKKSTWVLVAIATIAVSAWPAARAQDDGEADGDFEIHRADRNGPAEQAEEIGLVWDAEARVQAINGWKQHEFGGTADPRSHLEKLLELQLASLRKDCDLSDHQQKKLRLAGQGDIKRFLDRLQELAGGPGVPGHDVSDDVLGDLQALAPKLKAGFFIEGSLFLKVLATTLSSDQLAQRVRGIQNRNARRYAEAVRQWIGPIGNMFDLRSKQSDELARLIIRETSPPLRFGQSDYTMVMYQMAIVPEAQIRAVVTERQWKEMRGPLAIWAKSQANLKESGFVFEEAARDTRTAPAAPAEAAAQLSPKARDRR
jgi:hypothetical protein